MKIFDFIWLILGLLLIVGLFILMIYIYITYGNMPIDEVPSWVHWLMWSK